MCENISAFRINKAATVFLKQQILTSKLSQTGIWLKGAQVKKHGNYYFTVFATVEHPKCFECGDTGHKRFVYLRSQELRSQGAQGASESGFSSSVGTDSRRAEE